MRIILIKKIINLKQIKYLTFLLLVFLYSCIFIFFLFNDNNEVIALSGDYSARGTGDSLTAADWNYLNEDFVKKDSGGDTMSGNLNMGNNHVANLAGSVSANSSYAATVGFVNLITGSGATDKNGNPKKLVCGSTAPGATGWQEYFTNGMSASIDTRSISGDPNFSLPPLYLISIEGVDVDYKTGANAIYQAADNGFKVYLRTDISSVEAENREWVINWCGVGD